MLFFTTAMIGVLYLISLKIKRIPKILVLINNYSFSIYLLNTFYINITYTVLILLKVDYGIFNVFIYFVVSTTASKIGRASCRERVLITCLDGLVLTKT